MNFSTFWLLSLSVAVFLVTWVGTGVLLPWLRRAGAIANPNARSSHAQPTPTGGGVVPVAATCAALGLAVWLPGFVLDGGAVAIAITVALGLSCVSWVDDLRGLSPVTRLITHSLAASAGVLALPGPVFQGLLPLWADLPLAAILWVWFVNVFNFMDGIDGIAGVETIGVGAGAALVAALAAAGPLPLTAGLIMAASGAGFLMWNWQPARVFLGDSGAVPLGFLLGWVLLVLAALGYWAPAVILPLVFVSDATVTLLVRLWRREPVWRAHCDHFYQRAALALASHRRVVTAVSLVNVVLVILAAVAVYPGMSVGAVVAATILVVLLLCYFQRAAREPSP